MRGGELSHLRRDWVDLDRRRLEIPSYDPCDHGRGGDHCGYCRSQAQQAVDYRPDERTLEDELATRWKPKLEASHRTIPYRFDDSLVDLFDRFFAKHDRFPWCRSLLNRLMNDLAEESSHIEKQTDLYPYALRGHAARRFARMGMRAHILRRLMGWATVDSAMDYVLMEANDVEEELFRLSDTRL